MYYFLTEDEAFKVLLTMGHLANQKDKTKVRRKNCCTFLEEEMSYGNGMKCEVSSNFCEARSRSTTVVCTCT